MMISVNEFLEEIGMDSDEIVGELIMNDAVYKLFENGSVYVILNGLSYTLNLTVEKND